MARIFPPLTSGQLSLFLLSVIASSAVFFYLGARFGAKVHQATDMVGTGELILLPDERIEKEVAAILAEGPLELKFHELLQGDAGLEESLPKIDSQDVIGHDERVEKLTKNQLTGPSPGVSDPPKSSKTQGQKREVGKEVAVTTAKAGAKTEPVTQGASEEVPGAARFRLQVGSYSELTKAKADMTDWQRRGYEVQLITANIPGKGTWYRLQIGRYQSMQDVKRAQGKIMKEYGKTAMIMPGE